MLTINFHNIEAQAFIDGFAERIGPAHMHAWLQNDVVKILRETTERRFATEGADAPGGRWADLKPVTVEIRTRQGFPGAHPINERTGKMLNVMEGDGEIFTYGNGTFALNYPRTRVGGELRDKLIAAQRGLARPATVARPVLFLTNDDRMSIFNSLLSRVVLPTQDFA